MALNKKLKKIIEEEIRQTIALAEARPLMSPEVDALGDSLVHAWNRAVKAGVSQKEVSEYIMNWGRQALKDAKD